MTPKKAAEVIGCSISQIKYLIKTKQLKARKVKTETNRHGYCWDIHHSSVNKYAKSQQSKGWPRGKERK